MNTAAQACKSASDAVRGALATLYRLNLDDAEPEGHGEYDACFSRGRGECDYCYPDRGQPARQRHELQADVDELEQLLASVYDTGELVGGDDWEEEAAAAQQDELDALAD